MDRIICHSMEPPYAMGVEHVSSIRNTDGIYQVVHVRCIRTCTKQEYIKFALAHGYDEFKGLGTYFFEVEILPD